MGTKISRHSTACSNNNNEKRKISFKRGSCFLTEKDLCFLSSQTDLSREEIIEVYNKFYQKSENGHLTKEQFLDLYNCFIRNEKKERVEKIIEHIFRAFDCDRSGYIEFGEFLAGLAVASRGDLETRLCYAFDCYDADYSEYIEKNEIQPVLEAMMKLLGIEHTEDFRTEKMVNDIMEIVDSSNDGKISKAEFVQALTADEFVRGMLNPFN